MARKHGQSEQERKQGKCCSRHSMARRIPSACRRLHRRTTSDALFAKQDLVLTACIERQPQELSSSEQIVASLLDS